jgi:hypothetical protein
LTSDQHHAHANGSSWRVLLAFAVVYLVWGSTYLAIRFAVESIPPLLMAGTRFLVAGGVLYAWQAARASRRSDARRPTSAQWKAAAATGLFLISASYGLVSWAELTVPSGIVALVTAMTPLWMVVIAMLTGSGRRPHALVIFGIERVTLHSLLAWIYLIVAGSIVAYSAYLYLLKSTSLARAPRSGPPLDISVQRCTLKNRSAHSQSTSCGRGARRDRRARPEGSRYERAVEAWGSLPREPCATMRSARPDPTVACRCTAGGRSSLTMRQSAAIPLTLAPSTPHAGQ